MIFNRDMRVDNEVLNAHRNIQPLLTNDHVEHWFWRYDRAAVFWKKAYETIGTLSLFCVAFATLFLGYRVTLGVVYGAPEALNAAGVIFGGVGLVAQLALILGRLRDRWLLARFAAERMRCLKYQTFLVLCEPQQTSIAAAVEAHANSTISAIRLELRAGRHVFGAFKPASALPPLKYGREGDGEVLKQAISAYDKLRIDVQVNHFDDRIHNANKIEQSPRAIADWLFVAASLLTSIELAANGVSLMFPAFGMPEIPATVQPLWWFAVWTLFVVSAVLAIYGQARVQRVDADRYEQYRLEILDVRKQNADDWSSFAARVYAMELVALRELQDFCRDQKYFGYLF